MLASSASELARIRRINVEYHANANFTNFTKSDLVSHLTGCGFQIESEHGLGGYGMLYLRRIDGDL